MCSVVGCDSERRSKQRFKLPEDPERRLEWVQFLLDVNEQQLKESNWTDITICSEHFTRDCFESLTPTTVSAHLKCGAVPSLCIKSEPDEPELKQEPGETTDDAFQCVQLKTSDSPSPPYETSGELSPAPSNSSDAHKYDYAQMIQQVANIDIIREKVALLKMKGQYVINEKRLFQMFSSKCPLCGSKVKMEKFTYGVLIVLNRQCLQCEYRHQWKSQVNASIPTAEGQQLTGGTEVDLETVETDRNPTTTTAASEDPPVSDEESDVVDESEESGDGDMDLDEDWNSSDSEKGIYSEEDDPVALENSQLCTDCGKFFSKRKHHTCEHKIKPFSCNVCGKRCVNEAALNCHNRIHDENYEHPCKFCHVTFKTKPDKITHEQTHINDATPYKCPDCSDTFATSKRLRIHRRIHGERHLNCHICGIRFYRPLSLRRHLAVHTGDKPHKCSVCERGFNQAGHLKSHMRLHTGERPFKCQHCDKSFNHNVSLKSHVQRYHTPNSGSKKGEINYSVGDEAELDNVEEQHDKQEKVQSKKKGNTHRSTGRPVGRPKRNAEGNLEEIQDQCSNTKSAKVKVRKLKKTRCHDESEDELTESDVCFDQTEEEERTEKETRSTRKSRSRAQNSNSESDFEPEDSKKKRHSSPSKNSIC